MLINSLIFSYLIIINLLLLIKPVPAPPAFPPKTLFNETEARFLLNLSAGAYAADPQPCINRTFDDRAHMYQIYATNTQVCDIVNSICSGYTVVNEYEKRLYVIFRGTKTEKQLLLEGWSSFQPLKDFYGIGLVNKYYSNALEVLWANVIEALNDERYKGFDVTFTGHSLGGALASLASLKTVMENIRQPNQIRLVTFGQPRVGNVELANKHNELVPYSFRVVHSDDIVPHIPPCDKDDDHPDVDKNDDSKPCDPTNLKKSYHHGVEIWYPTHMYPNSTYYECLGEPNGEDFHCSDMLSFEFSKSKQYIRNHRYYYEVRVPPFGKAGCDPNKPTGDHKEGQESDDDIDRPETPTFTSFVKNTAQNAWNKIKSTFSFFG